MASQTDERIDLAELGRVVRSIEPSAFLVPPRILRRVIRQDRGIAGIGLDVPHPKSYLITRDALRPLVSNAELGLKLDVALPSTTILLAQPEPERLASRPRGEILLRYWRLLFHAHVHLTLERRLRDRKLTDAIIRQRIHQIGAAEFDEVRAVLRQEHLLLPPRDDRGVYVEFAAVYLELRHFAPARLARFFPALETLESIDALLAADVDAARLFTGTRLPGAVPPLSLSEPLPKTSEVEAFATGESPGPPSETAYRRQLARAEQASARGNVVRAAIYRTQAEMVAPPPSAPQARAEARADLDRLTERLQASLGLSDDAARQWREALEPLRRPAADGIWPAEARLLYDLQRVCVDHERAVYAVDLTEWAVTFGKRPIKRLLPFQPDVLAVKHLRGAAGRLPAVRVSEEDRAALAALLTSAVHQGEHQLRERVRPVLAETLRQVNLTPQNFPERIALAKLIEELLDRVCEHGYLTMSDLRDAVSRNNLKLPDLAGPGEFLLGDRLIRANRGLAVALDGVYRRGEIYLRWLQRLSSTAFGTPAGRLVTRFGIVPFGGAYLILEGLHYLCEEIGFKVELVSVWSVGLLGVFLLLLLQVAGFRQKLAAVLRQVGHGLRVVFLDWPAAVVRLPLVRALLRSRWLRFLFHYALLPLIFALPVWLWLRWRGLSPGAAGVGSAAVFLTAEVIFNSRLGRDLEEATTDWLMASWQRLRSDILPGLFRFVMDFFKGFLETVDRFLYTVDEWLRFRAGDSRLSVAVKACLGSLWSLLTYMVRMVINVLVEPQINPIKHFPVVTVSHKLLLPLAFSPEPASRPSIVGDLLVTHAGFGVAEANFWAFWIIASIPGVFGFMVWELKENWRLYRANRPATLVPVAIGHHGETMSRFLRPGFHSGTLPKLYARLRRAGRRARQQGDARSLVKLRQTLEQVKEGIHRFVERELVAVLQQSRGWGGAAVSVGEISLGSNRVRIELRCPELSERSLFLMFEEQAGWLVAGLPGQGWFAELQEGQRRVLRAALAGFYKLANVDLVREQIEASFAPARFSYDVSDDALVVWMGPQNEIEVAYDLTADPVLEPRLTAGRPPKPPPVLSAVPLRFRDVLLSWDEWVAIWEQDQTGKGLPESFLPGVCLLPTDR